MTVTTLPRRPVAAKSHTPSDDELAAVAASIAPEKLLPFIRSLKRERSRLSAAEEAHLVLMRMCADRAVNEDVPGNVDLALGELRWGR